jgi:hypothetical protein
VTHRPDHLVHANLGCGPIVTKDDDEDDPNGWDAELMGEVPNGHQYGYCPVCRRTFRWDVPSQRWVDWSPGG